ncbi:multidrug effflux MFS transporter [Comamonas flocculans]|uniref:Bcr/CflA family efflux transporter n=1 Tax=Comamonas flocculans TaxID=2597701 RepID=A0A5B8S0Z3_9BURK|nr:multidrug effflux MFS transporter [Comamonas flocculans]QEA14435.1 multidrug effflux MFS transporter [Comamonas flocculans]
MPFSAYFRMALVLGLLSAIGPFAIDMYLPALPDIGQSLHAGVGPVQWSLTSFFLALGIGQVAYGPLSDMFGRKPPLYFGLALFVATSVACALASDIGALVLLRFLQGLGAAAGTVIPRAVVRDLHTGNEAARLMALLMLVFSVSPLLAPLAGSGVIALVGWRGVFWAVALLGVAGVLVVHRALPETLSPAQRRRGTLAGATQAYWTLLRDARYLGLVGIGSFTMAGFFVFLAGSPFVFINHYGLTPVQYSLAFSANAAAFFVTAQFTARLGRRFGLERVTVWAASGAGLALVLLLACFLLGADGMWVLVILYFIASGCMGLVIPTTAVLALDDHGPIAGTASALMGTLQMLVGTVAMALAGLFSSGSPLPMVAGMATGALIGVALTWATFGRRRGPARAP